MKSYLVTWEINVDAENDTDAAYAARNIQLDPLSIATVFTVQEAGVFDGDTTVVDLDLESSHETTI